jgi:hypothetical protein
MLAGRLAAVELPDRHELKIELAWSLFDTRSSLGAWPDGGFGKLRYDSNEADYATTRMVVEYQGQILPTLFSHFVADVIEDAGSRAGLTEAYLEWRPVPSGPNRHRLRFGAFYPAFSMENSGVAWSSPYTQSFSALNSWIGEEIRPVGVDWRLARPIGSSQSPHDLGVFAGAFYGNDPAGTLLVWRGWSVHDRQTRLNERLPLPPLIETSAGGGVDRVIERRLDPIAEIDDRPGFYAGSEWRYANHARLSLGAYDNRGDPYAFRDGQWAWGTRFMHLALQVALPGDFGLVAQRMRGDTDWLVPPPGDGIVTPQTRYVTDEFDAQFVLLSKSINRGHRISLRFDAFDLWRPGEIEIDHGNAATVAYQHAVNERLDMQLEWLRIDSSRGLWPAFYGQASSNHSETLIHLGFKLALFDSTN